MCTSAHRGRGGKDLAASSRHPEFSRSMSSDNWREAKKRDSETEGGGSWRSRPDHTRPGNNNNNNTFVERHSAVAS